MAVLLDGVTLFKCFDVVSRCYIELNGLFETLNGLIVEKFKSGKNVLPCVMDDGKQIYKYRQDDSGWIIRDVAYSFPLKSSRKKTNPDMYLGYQVSMLGDGIHIPDNKEPLLHVFLWDCPNDLSDYYIGFPFDSDDSLSVIDSRLAIWGQVSPSNWMDRQWCFSLRLATLNHPEDLFERVVNPAIALLRGAPASQALPDGLPGLVRYPNVKTLTDSLADHEQESLGQEDS